MQWQMWTAFGIMLGFVASVAFYGVGLDTSVEPAQPVAIVPGATYLNWRLMLGATAIPPLIVMCQVYICPESPRWYMEKKRYPEAFHSFQRLRWTNLQAARDLYYAHRSLIIEAKLREGKNLWKEFFGVGRNRRAAQSSFFV